MTHNPALDVGRYPEDAWLADAQATARKLAAGMKRAVGEDVFGAYCANDCGRWCNPADRATCNHGNPVCEDCWPNGCSICEAEVEEGIRRREVAVHRITSAALELRTGADDLSEADMAVLGFIARKDILRHVDLTIEALRRVRDTINAQTAGTT